MQVNKKTCLVAIKQNCGKCTWTVNSYIIMWKLENGLRKQYKSSGFSTEQILKNKIKLGTILKKRQKKTTLRLDYTGTQ